MERSHPDIVVIGAGPAGLVLTHVLARLGHDVVVVEREQDPARGPQGALLQPVTLDVLRRLVSFDHSSDQDGAITAIEEYGPHGGLFTGRFAELPAPYPQYALNVTQGRLRAALLRDLAGRTNVEVWAGTEVRRLERTAAGACRTVVTPVAGDKPEQELRSRWIVAADGKQSATRAMAGIEARLEGAEHSLNLIGVPTPDGYPRVIRAHRRIDGMATTVPGAAPGLTFTFTHLTHRDAAPEQVVEWAVREVAGPDPVLGEALRRQADPSRLIRIEPQIVNAAEWRTGGVVLLGDSAHGMHNVGGQGLNTSIQDALLVAEGLHRHSRDGDTAAIDEFFRTRRSYIAAFQASQQKLGERFWSQDATSWFRERFEELCLGQPELRERWLAVARG